MMKTFRVHLTLSFCEKAELIFYKAEQLSQADRNM